LRGLAVLGIASLLVTPAGYGDSSQPLREAVTVAGVMEHLRAFQRIADQNGGTRASGTPGYDASAAYVKGVLHNAGYQVTEQRFTFPFHRELAPAELSRVSPAGPAYETHTFGFSGSGEVTGRVVPVRNNVLPPTPAPSSAAGCKPADFAPASAGEPQISLIQRGGCDFAVKAANARAAGYDAVILFNEGQQGREALLSGTLGSPFSIPVVGLSFADGSALAGAGAVTLRVRTSTENRPDAVTSNILAESRGGDPGRVLVVGAHLDSVDSGPGINDNGSGSATVLEIASQIASLRIEPRQRLRFAFWGAEEAGLLGSSHYVAQLSEAQRGAVFANLNFDMVGSRNYVRFVYDGDGSDTGVAGPAGSGDIEKLFTGYFAGAGLASEPSPFNGRSDYGPFIAVGIPAGGLFSGAEGVKTAEQAVKYGGVAGEAYDRCYHEACDDVGNLSDKALSELGDGAAHGVYELARTTASFPARVATVAARSAADGGAQPAR
jgi:Zn-dependent M28 family amino/carboxypeptidase